MIKKDLAIIRLYFNRTSHLSMSQVGRYYLICILTLMIEIRSYLKNHLTVRHTFSSGGSFPKSSSSLACKYFFPISNSISSSVLS